MVKNKKLKKKKRIVFTIAGAFFLVAFLLGIRFFPQSKFLFKSKATETTQIQMTPDTDTWTKEFYDLWYSTQVKVEQRQGEGPVYITKTLLKIGGPRVSALSALYGFKQRTDSYAGDNEIVFNVDTANPARKYSASIAMSDDTCIDLHSEATRLKESYIATLCFKDTLVPFNRRAYAPAADPYIDFTYTKSEVSAIQMVTAPFNKYISKPENYVDGPIKTRVTYVTLSENASLNWFTNVVYKAQFLGSDYQDGIVCYSPINNPQKYLKFTPDVKPEGGSNEMVTNQWGCNFELALQYLKPFFFSIYVQGGIPPVNPPISETPILSPVPTNQTITPVVVTVYPSTTPTKEPKLPTPTKTLKPDISVDLSLKNKTIISKVCATSLTTNKLTVPTVVTISRNFTNTESVKNVTFNKPGGCIQYETQVPNEYLKTMSQVVIKFEADKYNSIPESNERNNTAIIQNYRGTTIQ